VVNYGAISAYINASECSTYKPLSWQVGAIAAGNAIVIKPSESTPALNMLLAELLPKYLDSSLVRVVNGAVAESTKVRLPRVGGNLSITLHFSSSPSNGIIVSRFKTLL
jgi:hypothetical protein